MTRRKPKGASNNEQSERFKKAVRDLEAAGELDPVEAEVALDKIVRKTVSGG